MTRKKGANLLHYYVEKQGFFMTHKNGANLLHYYVEKQVSRGAPKLLNLMHYYVEKQVFSKHAKTLKFDALLRGKAGFLVTRQKGAKLLHYYVEKQVFS